MNTQALTSIEDYLAALRAALRGADPALVQDALYDAEEYLRAERASHPADAEAALLARLVQSYGSPEEVAAGYRTTERTVSAALATPPARPGRGLVGRFFAVYGDSRSWTTLCYALLALPTGILYFTVAVTGLSLSAGLAVLIFGIPFFLLFIGLTRILALAEGRIVEGMIGVRMPRRPRPPPSEATMLGRIKGMLLDRRTWTTLLYMLLMLPLGICYFTVTVVVLSVGTALTAWPVLRLLDSAHLDTTHVHTDLPGVMPVLFDEPTGLLALLCGMVLVTGYFHLVRAAGGLHGQLAKRLLVSREAD